VEAEVTEVAELLHPDVAEVHPDLWQVQMARSRQMSSATTVMTGAITPTSAPTHQQQMWQREQRERKNRSSHRPQLLDTGTWSTAVPT
jgi:hypothetical protein